jgi:hypothetical protein
LWETPHQGCANTPAPAFKLPAGSNRSGRLFLILSEVSRKEFCVWEPNVCQPENRAQKRAFFTFGTFRFWAIAAPRIDRTSDNPDDPRKDEMSGLLSYSASQTPSFDLQFRWQL